MSEKFNLMSNLPIVRDDKCISLANALNAAKKCSDDVIVIVKIGPIECHSLQCSQRGKSIIIDMSPGKINVGLLRSLPVKKSSKLKYNDEFYYMKNIKSVSVNNDRLVLQG